MQKRLGKTQPVSNEEGVNKSICKLQRLIFQGCIGEEREREEKKVLLSIEPGRLDTCYTFILTLSRPREESLGSAFKLWVVSCAQTTTTTATVRICPCIHLVAAEACFTYVRIFSTYERANISKHFFSYIFRMSCLWCYYCIIIGRPVLHQLAWHPAA